MNIGFYSATSGIINMQKGLDILSNNVANVSTNGYQVIRSNFNDLYYINLKKQNEEAQTGNGVKLGSTEVMFKQGQLQQTNRVLDFALPNSCFFAVQLPDGKTAYTRNGEFHLSQNENGLELVDSSGYKVLDYDGNPINVDYQNDQTIDYSKVAADIGTFRFDNPFGVEANGDNTYLETASSGQAVRDDSADKLSGALEMSGVDIADQMVKIISTQRAFQLNAKMLQTSDEIQSIVNNLR